MRKHEPASFAVLDAMLANPGFLIIVNRQPAAAGN
jgi:hypothetical protein